MTWAQFVLAVETQLAEKQIPRDAEIDWIDWDRLAFGGPDPGVHTALLPCADSQQRICISED